MQTEKTDWISPGYTTNKETNNQVCVFQIRLLNLHEIAFFRLDERYISPQMPPAPIPPAVIGTAPVQEKQRCVSRSAHTPLLRRRETG